MQQHKFYEVSRLLQLCRDWAAVGLRVDRIRAWGNGVSPAGRARDVANPLPPRHPEFLPLLADPVVNDPMVDHDDRCALILLARVLQNATRVVT